MYGMLDISTSGMIANRIRLTAAAANIANRNAILDEHGQVNPYRAKRVFVTAGDPSASTTEGRSMGVHVSGIEDDTAPPNLRFDPTNPYAYKDGPNVGYVPEPNVNVVVETMQAMEASRAYEANVSAAEATKSMLAQALRLIA